MPDDGKLTKVPAIFPVSTDREFLKKLNVYCKKNAVNRSKLVRLALEKELKKREK